MFFFEAANHWYEVLYDCQRGKLYHWDLTETIRRQSSQLSLVTDSLPDRVFNFIPIDSGFYFIRRIAPQASFSHRLNRKHLNGMLYYNYYCGME